MEKKQLLTIPEFAALKGASVSAVYKRIITDVVYDEENNIVPAAVKQDIVATVDEDGVWKIDPAKNLHVKFQRYLKRRPLGT